MHHTRGFMTRLSSHNRQKSSKSPAGRKTQKNTVNLFWVLVIQMTYKARDPFATPIRPQNYPQTHQNSNLARGQIALGRCFLIKPFFFNRSLHDKLRPAICFYYALCYVHGTLRAAMHGM